METLPRDDVRLHIVADAMRRRWLVILALTFAMAGLAAAYASTLAPSYSSSAKVLLRPIPGNALSADSSRNAQQATVAMETEAGLVSSPEVAKLVNAALKTSFSAGDAAVDAAVPANTQIVQVTVSDTSRKQAQSVTQAFADSFLAYRQATAKATLQHQLEVLQKQAKSAADNLAKVSKDAASSSPSPDAAAQVQLYTNRLANLQDSVGALESTDTSPGLIVTPATLPPSSGAIGPWLYILLGALVGLGLGFALAVWRERADDRVRLAAETTVEGINVLTTVAATKSGVDLVTDRGASPVLHDAFRRARAGVLVSADRHSALVLSASDDRVSEATTLVAATNLAVSLASSGHSVGLVDATLHQTHRKFYGLEGKAGLSDLLLDGGKVGDMVVQTHGIAVLPVGTDPGAARELLASTAFAKLISELSDRYDYLLVAAPPASTADGNEVALACDGLILVVTEHRTTHRQVDRAARRARQLGVRIVGVIGMPAGSRRSKRSVRSAAQARFVGRTPARPQAAPQAEPVLPAADAETTTSASPGLEGAGTGRHRDA